MQPCWFAAAGLGPSDGFSYKAFVGDPPRTRWGDYGAAVAGGSSIWLASEYVAQTCTYAQYYPSPPSLAGFGGCSATRTSLANWERGRQRRPRFCAWEDRLVPAGGGGD